MTSSRPEYRARIERIFDHATDTRSLFIRAADDFRFVPGQFISIAIPLAGETRVRPYTIASSPQDGQPMEICFNQVPGGEGVRWLFERRTGDELTFTGPFGAFTMEHPPTAETVFVAVATSIAPIRPMLRLALSDRAHPALSLLYMADSLEHLLYRDELERWARADARFSFAASASLAPRFSLATMVAPAADLDAQLYDEVERRWVKGDGDRSRHFYICGVGQVVLRLRDLLRGAGYQRRAVRYESW